MFTFLEELPRVSRGFNHFPKYESYRAGFQRNINTAVKYYREHDFAVRSDHILIRLLMTLPTRYWEDVELYYSEIHDLAYETAGKLKITCPIYAGQATERSWLFGNGFAEFPVALHSAKELNVKEACAKWQQLETVRFIRHPRTGLDLKAPMELNDSDEYGVVVYQINIPALALQYRMWSAEQYEKPRGERETLAHFVAKYPIANSIPSMVNVSFFNRLAAKLNDDDLANSQWRYPMALSNNLKWLDAYLDDVVQDLRSNSYTFNELLYGLRTLNGHCLYDLCKLPTTITTRQCSWLSYMAQSSYVLFLLQQEQLTKRNANTSHLNEIHRDIRYAFNDNLFKARLPSNLVREITTEFKTIMTLCN